MRLLMTLAVSLPMVLLGAADAAKMKLKTGTPDIKSAGKLAFGPDGLLFVGDTQNAAIYAFDTGEPSTSAKRAAVNVAGIDKKIAAALGAETGDILINDVKVNPKTGTVYLSVSRGRGPHGTPAILRVGADGKLSSLSLKKARYAKAALPNAPKPGGTGRRNRRAQSITDLAVIDNNLIVAGLSNEEFASKLRVIPIPFDDPSRGASVEIFHGSHGRLETRSPVRTFVPYIIDGKPHVVAGYTCTPLVTFPIGNLKDGKKFQGKTVAELGNHNTPLDIITYKKGGKDYFLTANDRRGVMKIAADNISKIQAIKKRVRDTAGLKYETVAGLKGVVQLDKLSDTQAVILVKGKGGYDLKTIDLP